MGLVRRYVIQIPDDAVQLVISGGAPGVDRTAIIEAEGRGLPVKVFPADWKRDGRRAGFIRNHTIVETADQVTAFWDGSSTGTAHTIQLARLAGKLRRIFGPDGKLMTIGATP